MLAPFALPLLLVVAPQEPRATTEEPAARGAQRVERSAEKPAEKAAEKATEKAAAKEEAPVVTRHELRLAGGRVLRYSVTTGLMPLKSDTGEQTEHADTAYGFGWYLGAYRGLKEIWHSGNTVDFTTRVVRFPERKFTIILLANRSMRENREGLFATAVMVITGFLLHRLNVSVTGLEASSGTHYFANWTEVSITLSLVGAGFLFFALAVRYLGVFDREPVKAGAGH